MHPLNLPDLCTLQNLLTTTKPDDLEPRVNAVYMPL